MIVPIALILSPSALEIGRDRQLFVDDYVIDRLSGVRLVLHEPRYEGPVLSFDKPWDGPFSAYVSVIRDGDLYRLYYRGLPKAEHDTGLESLCYAESRDGIHWTKPSLGIVEINGSPENNVLIKDSLPGTHSFGPFIDRRPGVPADERYKGLSIRGVKGKDDWEIVGFVSADGIRWRSLREEPIIVNDTETFAFDSQNVAFWSESEKQYVAYFRTWKDGVRRISRATSPDFAKWSGSSLMEHRHAGRMVKPDNLYTNQTHPYFRAPQVYVAIAARFMPGRQVLTDEEARKLEVESHYFKDTSDVIFMTTRGGSVYDCTFLESFIRPGLGLRNWVSRSNYPALNVVQTGETEMSLYVNRDYAQPTAHVARYSLRLDGFASARAPFEGGEVVTKPLVFAGGKLSINFSTSAAGGVRVELQDADGSPLPGFALADSRELIGDEIERVVSWKNGSDVSALAGKPVRLRFVMKDADIYSFRFE